MNNPFFLSAAELPAIILSVKVALSSSLISIPFAVVAGHTMARRSFIGKPVVESLITLPMVLPPVTTGYLLLLVLGSHGIVGRLLHDTFGITLAFTFPAAVIASVIVSFPLFIRSVRTAMEMVDTGIEDASHILGAGHLKTFFCITVPLALPGILAGFIMAFARSLGEFGATITFAGNIEGVTRTVPLAIYTFMQTPGKEAATLHLALISIAISFVAMVVSEAVIRRMRHS